MKSQFNNFPKYNPLLEGARHLKAQEEIDSLKKRIEQLEGIGKGSNKLPKNAQGTARQIALAFYYMRNSDIIPNSSGTNTVDAEFIHFLTGKDIDSLRKNIKDPKKIKRNESEGKATKDLINDLILIRHHFEKIMFTKGIDKIKTDLEILEKDLDSF